MIFRSILLIFLSSCSLFIENYEKDILEKNNIIPKNKTEKITCPTPPSFSLISENEKSQESFYQFIKNSKKKLQYIDKVVLWSLLQLNLRPDQSSPTAKAQVLLFYNNKQTYYNAYSKTEGDFSYLALLEKLLSDYKSKFSLYQLGAYIDKNFHHQIYVSKEFEEFLKSHKQNILSNKALKNFYLRGDETLKANERLHKINFEKLIKNYLKQKKKSHVHIGQYLFEYDKQSSFIQSQCNFDMNLYESSIFLISEKVVTSNIFGLVEDNHYFMAATSQEIKEFIPLYDTILLSGSSLVRSASLCSFTNKQNDKNLIWLFSSHVRDPGQHLFHLYQYGIHTSKSLKETKNMLSFSRHQFLKDPVRLVIESRRSSEQQINELLKLNVPIYNAKTIGKIWGLYSNDSNKTFILDERQEGHLTCK